MALIKCKECGKEISDQATICPNCGFSYTKDNFKKSKRKIEKNIKKQLPKAKKIIIVILSIIVGLFILEKAIDLIGNIIAGMKYQEIYTYEFDNREYYLRLEKNDCGFNDSAYENQFTFGCSYEITKGKIYDPEEFILHLTLTNLDDNDPNKDFGNLKCKRKEMTNSTKGTYYWVNCEKDNDYRFNVYTEGTK